MQGSPGRQDALGRPEAGALTAKGPDLRRLAIHASSARLVAEGRDLSASARPQAWPLLACLSRRRTARKVDQVHLSRPLPAFWGCATTAQSCSMSCNGAWKRGWHVLCWWACQPLVGAAELGRLLLRHLPSQAGPPPCPVCSYQILDADFGLALQVTGRPGAEAADASDGSDSDDSASWSSSDSEPGSPTSIAANRPDYQAPANPRVPLLRLGATPSSAAAAPPALVSLCALLNVCT